MRIVYIGSVQFSLSVLERLLTLNANIVGICTLQQSNFNADHVDLGPTGVLNDIPVLHAENLDAPTSFEWIRGLRPDIIFCFGWSKLLNEKILQLPSRGVVGFHPSSLPRNRGRHPLIWALVLGLTDIASTYFIMDGGADTGDIISQWPVDIGEDDDAFTLYKKITDTAIDQMTELFPKLLEGREMRLRQDERLSNSWRKRTPEDGKIDWRMSAQAIHNLVRGLSKPYVGAHFLFQNNEIKVWKTSIVTNLEKNIEPGKVLPAIGSFPVIKCGQDSICLLEFEPEIKVFAGDYV